MITSSMPLLGRVHIALLQLSDSADPLLSAWAKETLTDKVSPAFKVLPRLHEADDLSSNTNVQRSEILE